MARFDERLYAAHRAVELAYREEWTSLLATLAGQVGGDVGLAEEAVAEAFAAATAEWPDRLDGVLHVVHLGYTEGHLATTGDTLIRAALCDEAFRLARLVAELAPAHAEAHGLLALLLLTDARRPARTDADGVPVSLEHQDRSRWDRDRIVEGTILATLDDAAVAVPPST